MSKKISNLTISYMLFLLLLSFSAVAPEPWQSILQIIAYIAPIALALFMSRESIRDLRCLSFSKPGFLNTIPLIAPTLSVIMIISYLTSLLVFIFSGKSGRVDLGDNYLLAIIMHALIPAVFEEILFRYLPMRLLSSHSRRVTVLVSALFFALVHHDLFSIPYAFVAGIVFMSIDLALDSVIPSVMIHFINNTLSVSLVMLNGVPFASSTLLLSLGVVTVASIIFIIIKRQKYKQMLLFAFSGGEKPTFNFEMLIFSAVTLSMAVIQLL